MSDRHAEFDRVNWTPGVPPEEIQRRSTEEFIERVEAAHAADHVCQQSPCDHDDRPAAPGAFDGWVCAGCGAKLDAPDVTRKLPDGRVYCFRCALNNGEVTP